MSVPYRDRAFTQRVVETLIVARFIAQLGFDLSFDLLLERAGLQPMIGRSE